MSKELVIVDSSPHGNTADAESNQFLLEMARWWRVPARILNAEAMLSRADASTYPKLDSDAVVVPRADLRNYDDLVGFAALLRAIERSGAQLISSADALVAAEDKYITHERLAAAGVPTIPTIGVRAAHAQVADIAAVVRTYPVVLKSPVGWGGHGVAIAKDEASLKNKLARIAKELPRAFLLVQPFLPHKSTLTVLIASGRVVAAYRAFPAKDDFRSNPRLGGATTAVEPALELVALGRAALTACGLQHGSVDCIETDAGSLIVAEVNAMPGLWRNETGDRKFAEAIVKLTDPTTAPRRVALLVPFRLNQGRGNSVSAKRLAEGLVREGLEVLIVEMSEGDEESRMRRVREFAPDVIHAIHALHAGPTGAKLAKTLGCPLVLSFRGSDLDVYLEDAKAKAVIGLCIQYASAITALTDDQAQRLIAAFPECRERLQVIVHGVEVGAAAPLDRARIGVAPDAQLVVQIAGIRAIKGFPESFEILDALHKLAPKLNYALAGPILEAPLGKDLQAWLQWNPWTAYVGELPQETACNLIATANVTLHASHREGLSNALLESMALGVPVVARDIPASRSVITHEVNGLLFQDAEDAVVQLHRVLSDRSLARALAQRARDHVAKNYSALSELSSYLAIYRRLIVDSFTEQATVN